MQCIVMSAPEGRETWRVHRSVEVLSYHLSDAEPRVEILLVMNCENLKEAAANYLRFLHRGAVNCRVVRPWKLPRHPDEPDGQPPILEAIYGRAFIADDSRVLQSNELTAWDSWYPIEQRPIWPWMPPEGGASEEFGLADVCGQQVDVASYQPFSEWQLGPFECAGRYLIALRLTLKGPTLGSSRATVERGTRAPVAERM